MVPRVTPVSLNKAKSIARPFWWILLGEAILGAAILAWTFLG